MPLYARYGIIEVWLVDLSADSIEVYCMPSPEGYREVQKVGQEGHLSAQAFSDVTLAVDEVLG